MLYEVTLFLIKNSMNIETVWCVMWWQLSESKSKCRLCSSPRNSPYLGFGNFRSLKAAVIDSFLFKVDQINLFEAKELVRSSDRITP